MPANRPLQFFAVIDEKHLTGCVTFYSLEDELSLFFDYKKWSGKMGKVLEVAKLAQMTNKRFSYGFIEEQLLYDHSVKAFLDLFAFKHFQDLLIMVFNARVN